MRVVLLGPPGAGKGTQAKLISENFKIQHVSTGDIFRKHISEGTPLGVEASKYINDGNLVPDEITIGMVDSVLKESKFEDGFLMDGFPRTVNQAEAFDKILEKDNKSLDVVLLIDVPSEFILERMTGRRVCLSCGASYHVKFNPPKKQGTCDCCGKELIQRKDDSESTVKERIEVYNKQTNPLVDYYERKGILRKVDGTKSIDEVFQDTCAILGSDN